MDVNELALIMSMLLLLDDPDREDKYFYDKNWFNKVLSFNNDHFYEYFRMTKPMFYKISDEFHSKVANSFKTKQIFKEDFLMFLAYVGRKESFRGIRETFGIPKSTFHRRVSKFTDVIFTIAGDYVRLPEESEFEELALGLKKQNIDNIILVIDGTHIKTIAPRYNTKEYFNRKGDFSLNVLAIVDYKKRFRFMSPNFGSAHDSRCFHNAEVLVDFSNNLINYKILGDQAFRGITGVEAVLQNPPINLKTYYKKLQKIRIVVEHTFGTFKKKFQKFGGCMEQAEITGNQKKLLVAMAIWNLTRE